MEQVATYPVPVYIAGDFNIRLDRPDDAPAVQLRQLVDCYGLLLHDSDTTHQLGGTLDAVITRDDVGRSQSVTVADVGLSDHHLLQWSVPAARSPPPVELLQTRPRRKLNVDDLRAALSTSSMCRPDEWPADVDDMAALYDRQLTAVLDHQLIPLREVTRRPRPSDPWFDVECRAAKGQTRRLEREHPAACRRLARAASCGSSTPQSVASTDQLDVPTCRRSTTGSLAFPVAGAKVWNGLPSEVTSASSPSVFKNRLKAYLFRRCYETV